MGWPCQLPSNLCLYFRQYRLFRCAVLIVLLVFYCEFFHYFFVLIQCTWPLISNELIDNTVPVEKQPLRIMILGDTHLLGNKAHWFDKLRREWQMERSFQTSMLIHSPDVVFVLGDLLDEGKWCSDAEFQDHVKRFHRMFSTSRNTDMFVLVGNHDIGFHYVMTPHKEHRFESAFDSPSVRMLRIRGNIFVLVNSMALEGDGCSLCRSAENNLKDISQKLKCNQFPPKTSLKDDVCLTAEQFAYTRPVLLQHFPMYRHSDIQCDTPDAAPQGEKEIPFRPKWDCLSETATKQMFDWLDPRLVVTAHTHHGCYRVHDNNVPEWTVASYNWRNKNNPSFILATINNDNYELKRCYLPEESTVIAIYCVGAFFILVTLFFPRRVVKFNTEKAH